MTNKNYVNKQNAQKYIVKTKKKWYYEFNKQQLVNEQMQLSRGRREGTGQLQASEKRKEEGYEEKRENGFSICLYEPVW